MKTIVKTDKAPAPIGPYNQAVLSGTTLYISGQIALDAESGELLTHNIMAETEKVMQNIGAILKQAGLGFEHLLKCSIFIKDMEQFSAINEIYASYFNVETAPARETVQVARLPKDVNVEISAVASKA